MDKRLVKFGKMALDLLGTAMKERSSRQRGQRTGAPTSQTRNRPSDSRPASGPRDARRGEVDTATARPLIAYEPVRDDDADPGEIVWAYVPYEDDPTQGKDRPLLVIGRIDDDVAALQLTSRARDDRHHHALGSGSWDRQGRPSWIKLDRLLRLDPDGIRREGATLDRERFDAVVAAWQRY